MSTSLKLLRIMSDKKPHTIKEMVATTGLTLKEVYAGMQVLRKNKCMYADDQPYSITLEGVDWLWDREARAERLAAKEAKPKRAVGRPKKPVVPAQPKPKADCSRTVVPAPTHCDALVSIAIGSQPALQAVWGAR